MCAYFHTFGDAKSGWFSIAIFQLGGTPPPLHKNLAGGPPVKLIISRAATARLVCLTRFVAASTPTRRGGSADQQA